MCNNCNQNVVYKQDCHHSDNRCIELNAPKCDKGCEDVLSTDCIFHNINNDDQSAKLTALGITTGSSLKYILKRIDLRLSESVNTSFNDFNMNGLNDDVEITNIRQFVSVITNVVKVHTNEDVTLGKRIEILNKTLEELGATVLGNNTPKLANSALNINTTDTLLTVVSKLVNYVSVTDDVVKNKTITGSDVVSVSEDNTSVVVDLKISAQPGNRIIVVEDGLFIVDPSITSILKAIGENPALNTSFTSLVNGSFPALYFDIMATSNQIITYVNSKGQDITVTAIANTLLSLKDIKRIITPPSTGLTITFKGIQ